MPLAALAAVAEEVGRAVVSLGVRYDFLYQIVSGGIVDIKIAPHIVGIVADEVVDGGKLVGDESQLQGRVLLGSVKGHAQHVFVDRRLPLLLEAYLIVFVVIVELDHIAARHQVGIALEVVKLLDGHTAVAHAYRLGEEVQAAVVAVDDHLDRLLPGRPGQADAAAEAEAGEIAHVALVVVGMGQYGVVLALGHAQQRLFGAELEFEGFLGKCTAGIVAARLDFERQRGLGRADALATLCGEPFAAVEVEPVLAGKVIFVVEVFADNLVVVAAVGAIHIDVQHRQSARCKPVAGGLHSAHHKLYLSRGRAGVYKGYVDIAECGGLEVGAVLHAVAVTRSGDRYGAVGGRAEVYRPVGIGDFKLAVERVDVQRVSVARARKLPVGRTAPVVEVAPEVEVGGGGAHGSGSCRQREKGGCNKFFHSGIK